MWLFNSSNSVAQTTEHLKGEVRVDHSIMGGIRATQLPIDTVKSCVKPQTKKTVIKGKVKGVEKKVNEHLIKMGEASVVPEITPTSKTNTKK